MPTVRQLKEEVSKLKRTHCKPFKNMRKAELESYLAELKRGGGGKAMPTEKKEREVKEQSKAKPVKKKPVKKKPVKKTAPPLPKSKPPARFPPKPAFKPPPIPKQKITKKKLTKKKIEKATKSVKKDVVIKKMKIFILKYKLSGIKKVVKEKRQGEKQEKQINKIISTYKKDNIAINNSMGKLKDRKKEFDDLLTNSEKIVINNYLKTNKEFVPMLHSIIS